MSNISPQIKGEKIVFARDDGSILEMSVGEALRAYETAHKRILQIFTKTKFVVAASKGGK